VTDGFCSPLDLCAVRVKHYVKDAPAKALRGVEKIDALFSKACGSVQ
jgi:hypothetical protein